MPTSSATALKCWIETFLRRLVVIGRDHQRRVGPFLGGQLRQPQGLGRAVRAGAGHDLDPAAGGLHDRGDHPLVLFVRERRRFAGGADRAQAVRAGRDLKLDLLAEQLRTSTWPSLNGVTIATDKPANAEPLRGMSDLRQTGSRGNNHRRRNSNKTAFSPVKGSNANSCVRAPNYLTPQSSESQRAAQCRRLRLRYICERRNG